MPTLPIGAEQPREHVTKVRETAIAEHRCAICELADCAGKILRVAAREIHEQLSDDSAVFGVTLFERQDLLEVLLQRRRHCHTPSSEKLVAGPKLGALRANQKECAPCICAGTALLVMACGMNPPRLSEHVYSSFVIPAATSVSLKAR